ncbi:MAG TPA: DUF882 domain-containing protein [Hypericibacter adhaerens]|jgi:uncharacterized protein YcbK (DUF882 family)|uniref:Murein endopeptidase K n=1 Tax=Hypericibacter adhaerens TaxID=2602016 RepID=A0A5J6N2B8_9PROT|nr:DUF882 domain-containing protein [Hypericibacter adhaerens]QEX23849.1 twin-arginine translocation pathway signal protein [Hypericibacter adhaerens]HWA43120.1 DUF882 domain-containing protein [Hypericibacter adhaerens]
MTKPAGRQPALARRRFLAWGAASMAVALPALAMPHIANAATLAANQRRLAFDNLHTGETLKTVYWEGGDYVPDALGQIDHILRDFRTDDVHPIDARLLDLLNTLHQKLGSKVPFSVISGYRSPKTNAALAEASNGVAKHSLHMEGQAIDIHLEDVALKDLRRGALALKRGGVGYYPASDFVHVDVGRVRTW